MTIIIFILWAQNAEGSGLGPFDCWLALRGLKTMALRMERAAASAAALAAWLQAHPLVRRINYPGLAAHPGAAVHAAQATAGGSLLSFETGRRAALTPQWANVWQGAHCTGRCGRLAAQLHDRYVQQCRRVSVT